MNNKLAYNVIRALSFDKLVAVEQLPAGTLT